MQVEELFSVRRNSSKLKSLYLELAKHESFNPYKANVITDMPKGGEGKNFIDWYIEEKERIESDIEYYKKKIQTDRKRVDEYIKDTPYPECEIVQYRIVNGLGWFEIGELLNMDRRTASRKFYRYVEKEQVAHNAH